MYIRANDSACVIRLYARDRAESKRFGVREANRVAWRVSLVADY